MWFPSPTNRTSSCNTSPAGRCNNESTSGAPCPSKEVLRIAAQTAAGLEAAHEQGVVHRDVKPGNILLEESVDRVLISDFGLARTADDGNLTRSGAVTGTPHYMSPEQAHGESIDARSDLFCLGSVIYFMCTGHPPFRAPRIMAVLNRICNEPQRPLGELNPAIPIELEELVDQLLSKSPDDRPPTAASDSATTESDSGRLPKRPHASAHRTSSRADSPGVGAGGRGSIDFVGGQHLAGLEAAIRQASGGSGPFVTDGTAHQSEATRAGATTHGSSCVPSVSSDPFLTTLDETKRMLDAYENGTPWSSTLYRGRHWDARAAGVNEALDHVEANLEQDLP